VVRLTILVPVFNEEDTLETLLGRVKKILTKDIELIVVDDASRDRSPEIIKKFVAKNKQFNIKVISHPVEGGNRGKGAGIQSALKQAHGDYFIIQDADLEYDPQDIPQLLKLAEANNYRAVYGSRFKGKVQNMARANYYANKWYNFMLRRMYPTHITDMHTCYKLVQTTLLREVKIESNGFGYAPELVSKLLGRGIEIHELPIGFYGRTKDEGKKINFKDGIECMKSLIGYRLSKSEFKPAPPRPAKKPGAEAGNVDGAPETGPAE
jgi:glycosyltransferase involved in cell wall biosynthesis